MPREAIKKLYYSIGEVSEVTDLKQYVLRYWESEFPQLSPTKNRAGNRTYREKDIELVNFIKTLLYQKKYTIEGARQKLKELQEQGMPLVVASLEEPVQAAAPPAPAPTPPPVEDVQVPVGDVDEALASGVDKEQYKRFLMNLR
ncbi:MAG: MerR family transcriptional regulator, partial [Candidatus Marinimicrobia bacterium]|nr:MerR family transcriptional regulator [Candidatus Neomarinimicrobiota bacterium]